MRFEGYYLGARRILSITQLKSLEIDFVIGSEFDVKACTLTRNKTVELVNELLRLLGSDDKYEFYTPPVQIRRVPS